jgi:hypothetical protein
MVTDAFDGCPFIDVRCCFVGGDDGCSLRLGAWEKRTLNKEERKAA